MASLIELPLRVASAVGRAAPKVAAGAARLPLQVATGTLRRLLDGREADGVPTSQPPPPQPPAIPRDPPVAEESAPPPPAPPASPDHVSDEPILVASTSDAGAEGPSAEINVAEPWPGYRKMPARDVIKEIAEADITAVAVVGLFERQNRARTTVIDALERRARELDRDPQDAPPRPTVFPGDRSHDAEPHHALNAPAEDPDPTEYPDPYDRREDPRAPGTRPTAGARSTSEPHPLEDLEADSARPPERDRLDG